MKNTYSKYSTLLVIAVEGRLMWGGRWTIFPDISLLLFKLYRQAGLNILAVEGTGKYRDHYSAILI